MAQLRIKGLVLTFNTVRSQLQAGIPADQADQFRAQVRALVRSVEEICRQHRASPAKLPTPSRGAYEFLKNLDLQHLPIRTDGHLAAPAARPRIINAQTLLTVFCDRMWDQRAELAADRSEFTRLTKDLESQVASIEATSSSQGVSLSMLRDSSRRVYCWLKFLGGENALTSHIDALQRASRAFAGLKGGKGPPPRVHLIHMGPLWRSRRYADHLLVQVNEGFVHADAHIWGAILDSAAGSRGRESAALLRQFADSDDFAEVIADIESAVDGMAALARGYAYDLEASFDRVNRTYFGGAMIRPTLSWGRVPTAAKWGHYRAHGDIVMISASLDDPGVPSVAVDFVMYHELLHKRHPAKHVNGRRLVHTPEFRADERKFVGYEEANRYLAGRCPSPTSSSLGARKT